MPAAVPFLPVDAPQQWTKPTLANTHNGKTYSPTHPDHFRVVFSAISSDTSSGEETYASALVSVTVSLIHPSGSALKPSSVLDERRTDPRMYRPTRSSRR